MTTAQNRTRKQPNPGRSSPAQRHADGHDEMAVLAERFNANRLLTTREAADFTMYTPHTLENLRSAGRGPAFIKVGAGAVAYRLADLVAWQEHHRVATLDQQ